MNRAIAFLMGPPAAIAFSEDLPAAEGPQMAGLIGELRCLSCGCTDTVACEGGCWWAEPGLCSQCAEVASLLQDPVAMSAIRTLQDHGYSPADVERAMRDEQRMVRAAPLNELQREVTQWARDTFGPGKMDAVIAHLADEVSELAKAPPHKIEEEAADILILLLQVAERRGFSLYQATLDKFEINKRRQWGLPDERGVIRHVEEGNDDVLAAT